MGVSSAVKSPRAKTKTELYKRALYLEAEFRPLFNACNKRGPVEGGFLPAGEIGRSLCTLLCV